MDVLIRAGLVLALAMLCYRVFAPFLTLTVWALILAVTLYPLHRAIADKLNGRQGVSATLLVLLGIVLLVAPTHPRHLRRGLTPRDDRVRGDALRDVTRQPDAAARRSADRRSRE
jgi:hypothetical protein